MVKVIYRVCEVEVEVVAGRSVVVNTYLWCPDVWCHMFVVKTGWSWW